MQTINRGRHVKGESIDCHLGLCVKTTCKKEMR
uniref:Uncharacterized protein n=1 Tax=Arundo donax TaxID=35708 RepID=A0A0A9C0T4_ARUDO